MIWNTGAKASLSPSLQQAIAIIPAKPLRGVRVLGYCGITLFYGTLTRFYGTLRFFTALRFFV